MYLCNISLEEKKELNPNDIAEVGEFVDVFLEEIPGVTPQWEIDLTIDMVLGTRPISKAPYRIASKEMKELNS